MERIYSENLISDGKKFSGYVYFEKGKICAVTDRELPFDREFNAKGMYVCPGFIDTHTHGAVGADFTFCSSEEAVRAANYHFIHGTTTIYPTTLASDYAHTDAALSVLRTAQSSKELLGEIGGAHIEGPYFAPDMAGAQNPAYLTDPKEEDYSRLLEKYAGFIKKWSYAPERDHNAVFCKELKNYGVLPSAGHTSAVYEDMLKGVKNGLRCVTHLYSCTSTITREQGFRRLGVIESAYLLDELFVELIADGKHIPPELIKLVFKLKGADKIMLVTDSLSIAGSKEKYGELNGVPYIVEDGVAKLSDRSAFAGSIATTDRLVAQCVQAGIAIEDAICAMTYTPAKAMGLKKGSLEEGYDADFVLLSKDCTVQRVYSGGICKFEKSEIQL